MKQQLCVNCSKRSTCHTCSSATYTGTAISECENFNMIDSKPYLKIAENEHLMHLIYDYFLDNVDEKILQHYNYDEIKQVIIRYLLWM